MQMRIKVLFLQLNGTKSTLHDWLQSEVIALICLVFYGFFPYAQFTNRSLKPVSKTFQQFFFQNIYISDQQGPYYLLPYSSTGAVSIEKRLDKKEPVMVYSFRENVPSFVSLISLVPSSNEDKNWDYRNK